MRMGECTRVAAKYRWTFSSVEEPLRLFLHNSLPFHSAVVLFISSACHVSQSSCRVLPYYSLAACLAHAVVVSLGVVDTAAAVLSTASATAFARQWQTNDDDGLK